MKRAAGCWLVLIFYLSVPAQTPNLVLPVGHTSSVSTAAFSPDEKYVITASWDNTAKIWLSPEGRLLLDLKGHNGSLTAAAYSHNGKYIVTTSKDSTAKIWRSFDGKQMHTLKAHADWVSTAVFSHDDKQVTTCSWDNTIKTFEVSTGRLLKTLDRHSGPVNSICYSPNSKYLLSCSKDSTAIIFNVADGKPIHVLREHKDWINSAVYNHDGSKVLTASKDGTSILWDTRSGKPLLHLKGHTSSVNHAAFNQQSTLIVTASNDGTARVWDAADGNLLHTLKGHNGPVTSARFDNSNYVLTAGSDNTARVWNETGKESAKLEGHSAAINDAVFDSRSNFILTASTDNSARIWDARDATLLSALTGHTSVVTSAAYSRDGNYLVTASWDNTAKIWNAVDGKLLSNLKGHTGWINSAYFSNDGRYVVTASSDNTARIWSVPQGKMLFELTGHDDWVGSAIFSADGKYVVTTSWDHTSRIYDASTGKNVGHLKGHTDYIKWINFSNNGKLLVTAAADNTARVWSMPHGEPVYVLNGHTDKVRTAEFSPDDKTIITASWDSTARIWDAESGNLLFIMKGHTAPVNAAMVSPDGNHVTTTSMDNSAMIWSLHNGKLLHTLRAHSNSIPSAHYSKDGKRIVLASWDNNASTWDAASGKLLHLLKGHSASLKSAAFSPDSKFVITTSEDNTLKKWNTETGEFLYTFFAVDSTDYLAIDKDGRYDGTENARKKLYYACGNEIVDLDQFKNLSWEPGLVSKLSGLNAEPVTAKKISDTRICDFSPLVRELNSSAVLHNYEITPRGGGVGEVQLYLNGKLIKRYEPSQLLQKNGKYLLSVDEKTILPYMLSASNNQMVIKATTSGGLIMSRGVSQVINNSRKATGNPDMYVISVGISDYKDDKLKLKYASKDAVDFNDAISMSAEKLLNTDGKQHVFSYAINTEAGNMRRPLKKQIEKLVDTIAMKARPDDILLIFFAGHGVLQSGEKKFYLLTAEASGTEMNGIEKDVAISTDELREWLARIKANKQLLILDACNSGQVVNQFREMVIRRDVPADQQRALENLKDRTGTFILCASASGQAAYETSLYGQGLLTYSLLSGLKFGNGLRDNKFIDVTRWFNAASDQVKTMAREIGGRQDPQIIGNASFEIGIVDKEVISGIRLTNKKMVFKSSRFIQDEELLNDDLDITVSVDREIANIADAKQSPWVFVAGNHAEDSYSIRGRYDVSNNRVIAKVSVFRNQKERIHQFEVTGSSDKKDELARKIVDITKTYMNQIAKSRL